MSVSVYQPPERMVWVEAERRVPRRLHEMHLAKIGGALGSMCLAVVARHHLPDFLTGFNYADDAIRLGAVGLAMAAARYTDKGRERAIAKANEAGIVIPPSAPERTSLRQGALHEKPGWLYRAIDTAGLAVAGISGIFLTAPVVTLKTMEALANRRGTCRIQTAIDLYQEPLPQAHP